MIAKGVIINASDYHKEKFEEIVRDYELNQTITVPLIQRNDYQKE
jgi:hypothetical protein